MDLFEEIIQVQYKPYNHEERALHLLLHSAGTSIFFCYAFYELVSVLV